MFLSTFRPSTGDAPRFLRCASRRLLSALLALGMALSHAAVAEPDAPRAYLERLDELFYLEQKDPPIERRVRNHLVPLGAIQKVRGVWSPRDSERLTGERLAYTWRVNEDFTAAEVVEELEAELQDDSRAETLFSCEGISCGSSVQWANKIFGERVLYGTQDSQVYRAFALTRDSREFRLLIYASARTVERQYVRAELLSADAPEGGDPQ